MRGTSEQTSRTNAKKWKARFAVNILYPLPAIVVLAPQERASLPARRTQGNSCPPANVCSRDTLCERGRDVSRHRMRRGAADGSFEVANDRSEHFRIHDHAAVAAAHFDVVRR